jgi:N-acetylglucosamine malate deacetylase 1
LAIRDYLRTAYRTLLQVAYARSRYRLFLKASFEDLDERTRRIALATDSLSTGVRPIMVEPPFGRSMLVVAPHQDDELVGCGGSLLRQIAAGGAAHVVFVQDGGDEHEADGLKREDLVAIREAEARRVAEGLGIAPPTFLAVARLDHASVASVAASLRREIDRVEADVVFVPFFLDANAEHRLTSTAVAEAVSAGRRATRIFCYEVWSLCVPNVLVAIDPVIARRNELLSLYASQMAGTDYVNWTTGLNMYRSRAVGSGRWRYVEAFLEMPASEYVEVVGRVLERR